MSSSIRFITQEPFTPYQTHKQSAAINALTKLTPPATGTGGQYACLMQCTGQNVRFTLDDATTPSATVGFVLRVGDPPLLVRTDRPIWVIEESQTATLIWQWGF